jgi:5-methylcytosine-specific restriction endonuclease McrA
LAFHGSTRQCVSCYAASKDRDCVGCGRRIRSAALRCKPCRRKAIPDEKRKAQEISWVNARRARKVAAEVAGPVPHEVYAAIRAEGPCVYCGADADTADHITPLARGGHEHEDNLVPCCKSCNSSKGTRLLTEWSPDRVLRAAAGSAKVAIAYDLLVAPGA